MDHISLDDLSTTRIEYELGGVETELVSLGIPSPKVRPLPPHSCCVLLCCVRRAIQRSMGQKGPQCHI